MASAPSTLPGVGGATSRASLCRGGATAHKRCPARGGLDGAKRPAEVLLRTWPPTPITRASSRSCSSASRSQHRHVKRPILSRNGYYYLAGPRLSRRFLSRGAPFGCGVGSRAAALNFPSTARSGSKRGKWGTATDCRRQCSNLGVDEVNHFDRHGVIRGIQRGTAARNASYALPNVRSSVGSSYATTKTWKASQSSAP
jgi:hypothetical protein